MSFRLTIDKLSDSDKKLVAAAVNEVRSNYRPEKVHVDEIHEGETAEWKHCLPEELLGPSVNHWFGSEIFLMTPKGMLYFLPILLSLPLLEPTFDYEDYFADGFNGKIRSSVQQTYSVNTRLLA